MPPKIRNTAAIVLAVISPLLMGVKSCPKSPPGTHYQRVDLDRPHRPAWHGDSPPPWGTWQQVRPGWWVQIGL